MATHSGTLAFKIPWTEELGAGYYPWGHKESGMTERLHLQFHFHAVKTFSHLDSILIAFIEIIQLPGPCQI